MSRSVRSAFTLIEMLVVMTVGMVVMMLAVGMIHRSMSVASDHQSRMDQSIITDRLMREFRRDAHRSKSFELDADLEFLLPDGSVIHYESTGDIVTRRTLVDGVDKAFEAFELGAERTARFESNQEGRITLTIQLATPAMRSAKPVIRIDRRVDATVGRWTQFAASEESAP